MHAQCCKHERILWRETGSYERHRMEWQYSETDITRLNTQRHEVSTTGSWYSVKGMTADKIISRLFKSKDNRGGRSSQQRPYLLVLPEVSL